MPRFVLHTENLFTGGSEHLVSFHSHYNLGKVVIVALISILQMSKLRLDLAQVFIKIRRSHRI